MIRPTDVRLSGEALRASLGLDNGAPDHVTGVTLDSRRVHPGDLYAALPGANTHGARFAAMAARAGAAAVLTDHEGSRIIAEARVQLPVLVVAEPRAVLGVVSGLVYGRPSEALAVTGITGTNGKTTTSYLLDAALRAAGRRTGVVGTVATQIGDDVVPAVRTTPEAPDLHALLGVMRERDVEAVTMEVSSHALTMGRVDGVSFDAAGFTNLSRDHLDFHGDMEQYYAAKAQLFTPDRATVGVVCVDDSWGRQLAAQAPIPITTYAVSQPADWTVHDVAWDSRLATTFTAVGPRGPVPARVGLPGRFNVANALGALALAVHLGVDAAVAAEAIGSSPGVPGRMEQVRAGQAFLAVVDYAHTPDAVAAAISAARETTDGRMLVVLGCGGDRDGDKRPQMGAVAAAGADVVVVTDDNPRSEEPSAIRAAIMRGAAEGATAHGAQVREVADRREAIEWAVSEASAGDCVLVLGKGHEQGQEAAGVTTAFDDRVVLREALRAQT